MVVCTSCGAEAPRDARFCPACGNRVGSDIETRKTVTVLFCDVVDSTPITEGDPEAARRVISGYFERLRAVIERHGGTVEKFIGDEVMGVFGVPQAHEDDALRAARAAVEIREALASLNELLAPTSLSVRIAVNTGEVVVGDSSPGHGFLTGDPVVVAKRLEQSASAGEILIGEATYALVRDAVVVEDAGEVALKGKREPIGARRLLAVITHAPGVRRRLGAPLVGRTRELALLRDAFTGAAERGRGHLFTVLGPAGVGKSRLVLALVAGIDEVEATVLEGRCLAYGEGITFWPLLGVVRQAAEIGARASPAEAQKAIVSVLADDPEAKTIAALIAGAVGMTDAVAGSQESFWAFRRLLEAVARDRPLILVFDDVHWGEKTFLDLVEYLGEAARDQPILIVCLARPELLELRPTWGGGRLNATSLLLEPLASADASRLIHDLSAEWLEEDARATIAAAAEGNPLFIEEMVAVARDRGTVSVPPTIQVLLMARLDHLDHAERAVIEAAAVAGTAFKRGAVQALVGADTAADERLEALARKELIRRMSASSAENPWFHFRHTLIREVAYDAAPKQRRAALHEQFAEYLEATASDRLGEVEEIVGYHFEQAHRLRAEVGLPQEPELARRAGRRLAAAGARAFAREDMPAARALLERACSILPEGDPERLEAQRQLGAAQWATGAFEQARNTADSVIGAAIAVGDRRVEWDARLTRAAFGDRSEELVATIVQAIDVFEELGDDLGLARAWRRLAFVAMTEGRHGEAELHAATALGHARKAGDRAEEARASEIVCMSLLTGPAHAGAAATRCERLLEEASGNILMEANVASVLAPLYALCDRPQDAASIVEVVRARFDDLGNALARAGLAQMLGLTALLQDDPVGAERELRPTLELLPPSALPFTAALLAEALRQQGRPDEAAELVDRLEPTNATADVTVRIVRARLATGHDPAAGAELAQEAVRLAAGLEEPNLHADALVALAEAQEAAGATEAAQAALAQAALLYEAKGNIRAARRARAAVVSEAPRR